MFDALAKLIGGLLEEFTFRKFFLFICFCCVCIVGLLIYESYTSYFRFSRLEEAAALLQKAEELDARGTNSAPELDNARRQLMSQINDAISAKPISFQLIPSTLKFSMDAVWKFLASSGILVLASLFFLKNIKSNPQNRDIFRGMLFLALLTGVAGVFVKPIYWPYFHIIILPLFSVVFVSLFGLFLPYLTGKTRGKNTPS